MFRGRYEHAIDGKGRTSLPARFREALFATGDAKLVVASGLESHLVAYPLREWDEFEERLSKLPQFDETVATLRRVYASGALECELDKLGRILIPARLREHAGLKRELIWVGMGRNLEIWSKSRFEKLRDEVLQDAARRQAMARRLAELGL